MSSPIPPDPYTALGVPKDSDISAIRTAHRKLVLKHHPDRIKDPALKEHGKDEFQKIQQAYELLSDQNRRARYDDKIKLAELRKEAMMRDPTPRSSYPSRHAPSASASREWNSDDQTYYEVRQPKESYFDSKEKFEEPSRTTSRKYADYERPSSTKKAASEAPRQEKSKASSKWTTAFTAVNVGIKIKQESDRRRGEKEAHSKVQEARDREKRRARQEKEQQTRKPYAVSEDSDSDTATRVTASTIKPSKSSSARHSQDADPSRRPRGPARSRSYTDGDSDQESAFSDKWQSHHNKSMDYILKASAAAGHKRPSVLRETSGSYWGGRKNSSDNERRPTSSRGRDYEEPPPHPRPSMPNHSSAPNNLKTRIAEERASSSKEPRRSATGSYPVREKERDNDYRKEMGGIPSFSRSQTMPTPKSSGKKDAAPSKSSNLKHAETHDSGYGSSSTPEMRGESPSQRPKETKTKYQIVDPVSDDDDRGTQVRRVDSDSDHRRRRQRSPDTVIREPRREKSEKMERPKLDQRSRTTREALSDRPKMRHSDSLKYDRSSREATPSLSRNGSGRERPFNELSDGERERERYKYTAEKVNVRPAFQEPLYSSYRESPDRRGHDHAPGSRFQENVRQPTSRRPSVY